MNEDLTIQKFEAKWRKELSGQACVDWANIPPDSKGPPPLHGKKAWDKIYNFSPPFKYDVGPKIEIFKPFKYHIENWDGRKEGSAYANAVFRKEKPTLEDIRRDGLENPEFCAFVYDNPNKEKLMGFSGILVDGNHRFLICDYLMKKEKKDSRQYIERCVLDVIYLKIFFGVIRGKGLDEAFKEMESDPRFLSS